MYTVGQTRLKYLLVTQIFKAKGQHMHRFCKLSRGNLNSQSLGENHIEADKDLAIYYKHKCMYVCMYVLTTL